MDCKTKQEVFPGRTISSNHITLSTEIKSHAWDKQFCAAGTLGYDPQKLGVHKHEQLWHNILGSDGSLGLVIGMFTVVHV